MRARVFSSPSRCNNLANEWRGVCSTVGKCDDMRGGKRRPTFSSDVAIAARQWLGRLHDAMEWICRCHTKMSPRGEIITDLVRLRFIKISPAP